MAYTEYFNSVATEQNAYYNYYNRCSVSHSNYYNRCNHGHYNVATRGSHYYNYYNGCSISHSNYYNGCVHGYNNLFSSTTNDKHADVTPPNWTSPWGGTHGARELGATYIEESIDAIKQLRDNIREFQERRESRNSEFVTDVAPTSTNVGDDKFDDADSATPEFVEDDQYDALRESVINMWNVIETTPTDDIPVLDEGNAINKEDWERLANKLDDMSDTATPIAYSNHFNTYYANKTYTPS